MLPFLIMAAPVLAQSTSTSSAAPSDTPTPILPPVMVPGSACPDGDNGQWNCLSNCWQRCAAGLWSDTMALAPGTRCIPLGLSFDLQVVNAGAPTVYTANATASLLSVGEATCVCSTTSCTVTLPSSSSSAVASSSSSPSASATATTNNAGLNSDSSGVSFGVSAVILGVGILTSLFFM